MGREGERCARRELARCGWEVLGTRVRTASGEVDLVARRAGVLACVEVKTQLVVALDFPVDGRWRPGKRFTAERARRQRGAALELARAVHHRGPLEVLLFEVWIEKGTRRSRGILRNGGGRCAPGGVE